MTSEDLKHPGTGPAKFNATAVKRAGPRGFGGCCLLSDPDSPGLRTPNTQGLLNEAQETAAEPRSRLRTRSQPLSSDRISRKQPEIGFAGC